ncbi:MAG TPA: hypothetical protein VFF41_02075 [Gallionella sp.]|nr:hypothetical protein [Gallionella sp.]
MNMLAMLRIRRCYGKPEDTARISGLVGKAGIGKPIEHTIERHPVNVGQRMMMQSILNVAVGERAIGRLKYAKHAHACSGDPRSRCADSGLNA